MITIHESDLLAPRKARRRTGCEDTLRIRERRTQRRQTVPLLRPMLELGIDDGLVKGRLASRRRGTATAERALSDVDALSDAIAEVLGEVLPSKRLANPHVRVVLRGSEPRSAVLRFDALPRSTTDRDLVIRQRFCREYRLDPQAVAISHALAPLPGGGAAGTIEFAPKAFIAAIHEGCAVRGIHADEIVSELSLAHRAMTARHGGGAGLVLLLAPGRTTFLLLDTDGLPKSVAALPETVDDADAQARMISRVCRYAGLLGVGLARFPLFVGHNRGEGDRFIDQLRRLGCPLETFDPGRAGGGKS